MLNWTIEYDDSGNAKYEAISAIGDTETGPFCWKITPKLFNEQITWMVGGDSELTGGVWDLGYPDPLKAAIEVQASEDAQVKMAKAEWDALPQAEGSWPTFTKHKP
jgi:hypothetical protein